MFKDQASCPHKVEVQVDGQPLTTEVYKGASVSIAPKSILESLAYTVEVKKTSFCSRSTPGSHNYKCGLLSMPVQQSGTVEDQARAKIG